MQITLQKLSSLRHVPQTTYTRRDVSRVILVALLGLVLVVLGWTGQAKTTEAIIPTATSAISASSTGFAGTAAATATATTPTVLDKLTSLKRTACVPGRETGQPECTALPSNPAHVQQLDDGALSSLSQPLSAAWSTSAMGGRIPAALTHLDLGILRT